MLLPIPSWAKRIFLLPDRWILSRLNKTTDEVIKAWMIRFNEATGSIYQFGLA